MHSCYSVEAAKRALEAEKIDNSVIILPISAYGYSCHSSYLYTDKSEFEHGLWIYNAAFDAHYAAVNDRLWLVVYKKAAQKSQFPVWI